MGLRGVYCVVGNFYFFTLNALNGCRFTYSYQTAVAECHGTEQGCHLIFTSTIQEVCQTPHVKSTMLGWVYGESL